MQILWKIIQKNTLKSGSPQQAVSSLQSSGSSSHFATITAYRELLTANFLKTYTNQQRKFNFAIYFKK